jgi:hypothetical protein
MRVRPLLFAMAVLLAGASFLARGQNAPLTLEGDANAGVFLGYVAIVASYWARDVMTSRAG